VHEQFYFYRFLDLALAQAGIYLNKPIKPAPINPKRKIIIALSVGIVEEPITLNKLDNDAPNNPLPSL